MKIYMVSLFHRTTINDAENKKQWQSRNHCTFSLTVVQYSWFVRRMAPSNLEKSHSRHPKSLHRWTIGSPAQPMVLDHRSTLLLNPDKLTSVLAINQNDIKIALLFIAVYQHDKSTKISRTNQQVHL